MGQFIVKLADRKDWDAAIGVAWTTFSKKASGLYSEEAINNFHYSLTSTQLYIGFLQGKYTLFCAYDGKKVIGMLMLRDDEHISLLYVRERFQREGVGTQLVMACRQHCRNKGVSELTVNASPTGLPFYLARGFTASSEECFEGGLRYTPMIIKA